MEKGFIQYVALIVIVLVIVFLSQGGNLLNLFGKGKTFTFINGAVQKGQEYLAKSSGWVADKVFPNIASEVEKRGEMAKEGIDGQKEKITESVSEKIKNYFSGVTNSILHPGTPQNCPPAQTPAGQ